MKANELMLADWVNIINTGHAQVVMVDQYHIQTTYAKYLIDERKLEPILITAEILKANGFIRKEIYKDGDFWDYIYSQHDGVHDFYCKARFVDSRGIDCCEFSYYTYGILSCNVVSIKYRFVHELQHAMRLIGLADLADNFKVV